MPTEIRAPSSAYKVKFLCDPGHSDVEGAGDGDALARGDQAIRYLVLNQQNQSHNAMAGSRLRHVGPRCTSDIWLPHPVWGIRSTLLEDLFKNCLVTYWPWTGNIADWQHDC
jgi:hypothetical protein